MIDDMIYVSARLSYDPHHREFNSYQ